VQNPGINRRSFIWEQILPFYASLWPLYSVESPESTAHVGGDEEKCLSERKVRDITTYAPLCCSRQHVVSLFHVPTPSSLFFRGVFPCSTALISKKTFSIFQQVLCEIRNRDQEGMSCQPVVTFAIVILTWKQAVVFLWCGIFSSSWKMSLMAWSLLTFCIYDMLMPRYSGR
jgi:hypothetical protein